VHYSPLFGTPREQSPLVFIVISMNQTPSVTWKSSNIP
jgi:hypothetical protein